MMRAGLAACAMRLLVVSAIGLASAGCVVDTVEPAPVFLTGRATLNWSINGAADPAQCVQGAATTIDIRLIDAAGRFAGEYVADCAAFATTIDLPPGGYTGTAELLDAGGAPRTTQVDLQGFAVDAGANVVLSLEFPADSFLARL